MSSSPAPAASPSPALPPPVNDTIPPPTHATPLEPITSPPSPPSPPSPTPPFTPVLPPTSTLPPLTSPPPPPPPPLSSVSPVGSPPPLIPPVVSPPPPVAPIPPATKPPLPALIPPAPVTSRPPKPPQLPVPPVTSPTPPSRTIITPETSPPPPPPARTITPITSPPPPITPLVPAISPPPSHLHTPLAPSTPPLPPPSTVATPSDLPPLALQSPPPSPGSFTPPPLPLAHESITSPPPPESVNGISPVTHGVLPPPASNPSNTLTGLIAGIAIGGVFLLLVFSVICFLKRRKRENFPVDYDGPPSMGPKDYCYAALPQQLQQNKHSQGSHVITVLEKPLPSAPAITSSGVSCSNNSRFENSFSPQAPIVALGFSNYIFTYEDLSVATGGFSEANLIGQGGFGYVHKGILRNGKEVAVKQLKIGSHQGEREFQAEVYTISRVHHRHLVSLVGYCITGAERLLVYEFVPNNTLEFHLHGNEQSIMEWATRMKIAIGSAKGLGYLHEDCDPTIIHRDIKAANILLDLKFEAKVSDFGLAKFFSDTNTHISTRVVGTFGYMAPEYAASGKVTYEADVFSYGVMLLELISGRLPINTTESLTSQSLVEWARPLLARALEDGNFDTLVDPRLQRNYNTNEMASMVACAASCVRHSAWRRPQMSQVVRVLEGDVSLNDLNKGIRPGYSTGYDSYESSNYDGHQYKGDIMKKFQMALESQEYGISKCTDNTSEYGLNPSSSSSNSRKTT